MSSAGLAGQHWVAEPVLRYGRNPIAGTDVIDTLKFYSRLGLLVKSRSQRSPEKHSSLSDPLCHYLGSRHAGIGATASWEVSD